MKIRRITLAVLVMLTLLVVFDFRILPSRSPARPQAAFYFELEPLEKSEITKSQIFRRQQDQLTSLVIKNNYGQIELQSTAGSELIVEATISAKNEDIAKFEVREKMIDTVLYYELERLDEQRNMLVGASYVVQVPAGMEVSLEQSYGSIDVHDFVGFVQLESRFGHVVISGLQGSANLINHYGALEINEFSGPLSLESSSSSNKIQLGAVDGGYKFDVLVTNGKLQGNVDLVLKEDRNLIKAEGTIGEGKHPIIVSSIFGNVNLDYME